MASNKSLIEKFPDFMIGVSVPSGCQSAKPRPAPFYKNWHGDKFYLIVSPQVNNDLALSVIGPKGVIKSKLYKQGSSCEKMVNSIENFLNNKFCRISGLVLRPVDSTFMRQRLAVVVVNSLSYALGISALTVTGEIDYKFLQRQFSKVRRDNLIKTTYSRPAVG